MIILLVVLIVLVLIGIYGPMHDQFKEEERKREECHKEVMKMNDNTLRMIDDIKKMMDEDIKKHQNELNEVMERAKARGIDVDEILKKTKE